MMLTRFWDDVWLGEASLKVAFPRLFSISTQKNCSILEVKGLGMGGEDLESLIEVWFLCLGRRTFGGPDGSKFTSVLFSF